MGNKKRRPILQPLTVTADYVVTVLMIKSLIIIISVGSLSFFYTDIENSSPLFSVILPIVDFFALTALGFWLVALFSKAGINQNTGSRIGDGSGIFGGGDSGGDGGGC